MERQLIDRLADTTLFRVLLVLSGLMVLPVLGLGLLFSPLALLSTYSAPAVGSVAFVVLSTGGALGITGWLRARWGTRMPERHNIGVTLALITIGIATALAVGGFVAIVAIVEFWRPWGWEGPPVVVVGAFVAAHGVWIVSGVAWIERLTRSYVERTGREYDAIPVALLLVALGLTLAVLFAAATLV